LFELRLTGNVGHCEVALNYFKKGMKNKRLIERFTVLELEDLRAFIGAQAGKYENKNAERAP
jgi:hypothetical protein